MKSYLETPRPPDVPSPLTKHAANVKSQLRCFKNRLIYFKIDNIRGIAGIAVIDMPHRLVVPNKHCVVSAVHYMLLLVTMLVSVLVLMINLHSVKRS